MSSQMMWIGPINQEALSCVMFLAVYVLFISVLAYKISYNLLLRRGGLTFAYIFLQGIGGMPND